MIICSRDVYISGRTKRDDAHVSNTSTRWCTQSHRYLKRTLPGTLSCFYKEVAFVLQGQTPTAEDENTPQRRVDKIFSQMDKNHDDKLTLDEFREGSKADPRIVQALSLGDNWTSPFQLWHSLPPPSYFLTAAPATTTTTTTWKKDKKIYIYEPCFLLLDRTPSQGIRQQRFDSLTSMLKEKSLWLIDLSTQ